MGESRVVTPVQLARAKLLDINAVHHCDVLRPAVRRAADMQVPGARQIRLNRLACLVRQVTKGRFGQWRAADVAKADKQDALHPCQSHFHGPVIASVCEGW